MAELTPSQTVGPFLHIALADPALAHGVPPGLPGRITIAGRVTDGAGATVPDALIETWQVDGIFARCPTGSDGRWEIHTRKPPPSSTRNGTRQAPHLLVSVFARGLLDRLVTRIYFEDEEEANALDPVLAVAGHRRPRLIAQGSAATGYTFDVRLQGDDESVFFEL